MKKLIRKRCHFTINSKNNFFINNNKFHRQHLIIEKTKQKLYNYNLIIYSTKSYFINNLRDNSNDNCCKAKSFVYNQIKKYLIYKI